MKKAKKQTTKTKPEKKAATRSAGKSAKTARKPAPTEAPVETVAQTTATSEMPMLPTAETATEPPSSLVEAPTTPAAAAKQNADARVPPVGTVLRKQDRHGKVRCECVVEEGGFRYAGTVYRSLSAAAVAAARDLGLRTTSANGFGFWGLSKSARGGARGRDPLKVLDRAWTRLRTSINGLLSDDVPEEARKRVLAVVQEHAQTLARLGQATA